MDIPSHSQALRFHSFGNPNEVLRLEPIPLSKPKENEIVLETIRAPINPADVFSVKGQYGIRKALPAIGGMEGLGKVIAVGSKVSSLKVGDRCFIPAAAGSWQSHVRIEAATVFRAPEILDEEIAAMCWINPPTAWLMLKQFTRLKPGDWIIQNAATSAVGKLVIQFSRHLGYKTINLVRDLAQAEKLKGLGADAVLQDKPDAAKDIIELTADQKPKLALNAVGGQSVLAMAEILEEGHDLVTYGAMDGRPASFPARFLIFNDIRLRGFWVSKWYQKASRESIESMMTELFTFMHNTNTKIDIASTYPLSEYKEAIMKSIKPGKKGKILFSP